MAYGNNTKQKFIELKAQGLSYIKISEELGIPKNTLVDWGKKHKTEIDHYKSEERDLLSKVYYATKRHKLEVLNKELTRIIGEIGKRNLNEVKTNDLYKILLELYKTLKEVSSPTLRRALFEFEKDEAFNETCEEWVEDNPLPEELDSH